MVAIAIIEIKFQKEEIRRFCLTEQFYLLGRGDRCHIRFSNDVQRSALEQLRLPEDKYQSGVHGTLILIRGNSPYYQLKDGEVGIYSLGKMEEGRRSRNGIYVNNSRLGVHTGYRHSLGHGDQVRLSPLSSFIYLEERSSREKITRDTFAFGEIEEQDS